MATNEKNLRFGLTILDKNGNISATKMKRSWFEKNGLIDMWEEFEKTVSFMPDSLTPYQKYRFWQEGHTELFPLCHCGKPCKFLDRKPSRYCSLKCALTSKTKSDKLRQWYSEKADKSAMNEKRKKSMIEKYGVEYNSQREEIKAKVKSQLPESASCLLNRDWLYHEYVEKKRTSVNIAEQLGVYYGTVLYHCQKHGFEIRSHSNTSQAERDLADWISQYAEVSRNDRGLIEGGEIDIYIPSRKLGIEVNGLRYHSEWYKDKNYHYEKWQKAKNAGIKLLQFTDYELKHSKEIVHSMILASLGMNKRIPARKTLISIVPKKESEQFFNDNHIQGFSPAYPIFGLRYEDEWVFMMSFGKPRFDKKHDWEIVRMASKRGITVIGGLSKVLKTFKGVYPGQSLLSYVDPMKADGHSLIKVGFVEESRSKPGYFWTDGDHVISRFKAQKKQLEKWLPSFDSNKTEVQNMQEAGYARYWDCGQIKMVLR